MFYGFDDYKVHSKLTLITSKVNGKYHYLTQIGTGNYNEKTSELYTDLSFHHHPAGNRRGSQRSVQQYGFAAPDQ